MNTVAGSGSTLSGAGSGVGDGLSAIRSAYRQSKRPENRLPAEEHDRALERQLESIDDVLVLDVAISGAVGHAQLRLGDTGGERVELLVGSTCVEREPQRPRPEDEQTKPARAGEYDERDDRPARDAIAVDRGGPRSEVITAAAAITVFVRALSSPSSRSC
jgi:hypothetical protein